MRILVTGSRGMLGQDLMAILPAGDGLFGVDIDECDITDPAQCRRVIDETTPDWIVNAAAFTAVDACETDRETAMRVNGAGPENMAREARRTGARLLHVSTDYVFDGLKRDPYLETDPVNPQTVYGASKLEGERRVISVLPEDHLIVRTSWLFGVHGGNFVETILKAAAAGRDLRVVGDQVGCPTFAADLAQAIRELIQRNGRGIVHAANTGNTTWFAFAEYFVNRTFPGVSITPVTTDEYPRPAKRPPYSVLSTDRLKRILGHPMPAWQDAVDRYLGLKYPERIKE